jgi:hypothetical protein
MAKTKIIVGYLATPVPVGAATSFTVYLNDGGNLTLEGLPSNPSGCGFISRLELYDYNQHIWGVVATTPGCANPDTSLCNHIQLTPIDGGGQNLDIELQVQCLIGNVATLPFVLQLQVGSDDTVSKIKVTSLSIGSYQPAVRLYHDQSTHFRDDLILTLTSPANIDKNQIKVDKTATTPFNHCSGVTGFGSDNVTVLMRNVTFPGGTSPVPVLTFRRGFTKPQAPLDPRFQLEIEPEDGDSFIHATQFPDAVWLGKPTLPGAVVPYVPNLHVEVSGFTRRVIQAFWEENVRVLYLNGLRAIDDPLKLSLLPTLPDDQSGATSDFLWKLTYTLTANANPQFLSSRLTYRGYLASEGPAPDPVPFASRLTALADFDGDPVVFSSAQLAAGSLYNCIPQEMEPAFPEPHAMIFKLNGLTTVGQRLRFGSIDLDFAATEPASGAPSSLTVRAIFDLAASPDGTIPTVRLDGILPIAAYGPGGEDAPPQGSDTDLSLTPSGDTGSSAFIRSAPIVINAAPGGTTAKSGDTLPAPSPAPYILNVGEWTRGGRGVQSQQIVLQLQRVSDQADTALRRVLVLDREPFLVALVQLKPGSTQDSGTSEVGTWCNIFPEGAGWRLRAGAQGFQLLLPPQAIGEAMIKGSSYAGEPPVGFPMPFRFSPLLSANLKASLNDQNAVEPGWNTRRVLGFPGQRAPGAVVDDKAGGITFELAYGMSSSVTEPNLRLAEIFARLGNFPGPLPSLPTDNTYTVAQINQYNSATDTWAGLYQQTYARPGVLELWDDPQGAELFLDEGVQFTLRDFADMRYPDNTQFPPGQKNGDFSGGVGWALDSANVAAELLDDKTSIQGTLSKPMFTSLGGFGTQRATFAGGKVIIDSRTSLGRLESLTVTLVGRVGVLWNHALHVTVYERTVLPSQQFQQDQDRFEGLPLLRKTSEYVELLEQSRSYPEDGASSVTRAFVMGSSFKTKRIPVDSRWGGDVGKIGWQVPLWQPNEDPSVYPRPHIGLCVAIDPDLGVDFLTSEILDPDKLCFYTDTQIGTTADTDLWAAVTDIDYIDQPAQDDQLNVEGQPFNIEPGFGRFTYHLSDLPLKVNLVAERTSPATASAASSNPVGARLSNASMMRSKAAPAGQAPPTPQQTAQQAALQQVRRLKDWWSAAEDRLKQPLAPLLQAGATAQDIQKAINDRIATLQSTYLKSLQVDLKLPAAANLVNACDGIAHRLDAAIDRSKDSVENVVRVVLVGRQSKPPLPSLPDAAKKSIASAFQAGEKHIGDKLSNQAHTFFQIIRQALTPYTGGFTAIANLAQQFQNEFNALKLDAIQTLIKNGIKTVADAKALLDALAPIVRKADGSISDARKLVEQDGPAVDRAIRMITGNNGSNLAAAAITPALDTLLSKLNATLAAFQDGGTISQTLLDQVSTGIRDIIAAINAVPNAVSALQAARSDLEKSLDDLEARLAAAVQDINAQTVDDFNVALDAAFLNVIGSSDAWNSLVQTWLTKHESWIPQAGNLCARLQRTIADLQNQVLQMVQTDLQNLLGSITGGLGTDVAAIESAIADNVSLFSQRLGSQLDGLSSQLTQSLGGLAQQVGDIGPSVVNVAGTALRVLRAFGETPQVPNLQFTLPRVAYTFDDLRVPVGMTRAIAQLEQAANGLGQLSQMNVNLPTISVLDRILPDNIGNFNLNDIFPSIAGLNLSQFFSSVRMPGAGSDAIRITHKIDPQSRRAALDANVTLPLDGGASLFNIGPVTLTLLGAQFNAHIHLEAGVGAPLQRTSDGSIFGDWQLSIGGVVLLSFLKTTLQFDSSGKLQFSITPLNVRLHAVLQFLADLLNKLKLGGGVVIHATPDPVRVECSLDLPLPDIGGGTFAITNLHLGSAFAIGVDDIGFYMELSANLARQTAPFTLTIFILGGTGWFEVSLRYQSGRLVGMVTLGMGASASLSISLGPISGSVSISFAIFAQMQIGNGGGLSLGIMLLIAGHVSVLGIVEADLVILLEAEYTSGGGLLGRGMVSVKIKICWCFTLEVRKSVEYTFGSAGGGSQPAQRGRIAPRPTVRAAALIAPAAALSAHDAKPPLVYNDYRTAAATYVNMLA